MTEPNQLDPSQLDGTHRSRVFIGGSYSPTERVVLAKVKDQIESQGFNPVLADAYWVENQNDIHNVTLCLMHSCRLAVFDLSVPSGALMEIERVPDYGTRALILYRDPSNRGWMVSRMLSTFVTEHGGLIEVKAYADVDVALLYLAEWLRRKREEGFG